MKRLIVIFSAVIFISSIGAVFYFYEHTVQLKKAMITYDPIPTSIPNLNAYKIYDLVNNYRASKGLNKLVFDPSMCDYSQKRLFEIHTDWSHHGFTASPPSYFVPNTYIGENLAKGMDDYQSTVTSWIDSPEHLQNIVKSVYTRTCVVSNKDGFVVQEFASY